MPLRLYAEHVARTLLIFAILGTIFLAAAYAVPLLGAYAGFKLAAIYILFGAAATSVMFIRTKRRSGGRHPLIERESGELSKLQEAATWVLGFAVFSVFTPWALIFLGLERVWPEKFAKEKMRRKIARDRELYGS